MVLKPVPGRTGTLYWRVFGVTFILLAAFSAACGFFWTSPPFFLTRIFSVALFSLLLAALLAALVSRSFWSPLDELRRNLDHLRVEVLARVQYLAKEREEMRAVLRSMIEGVLVMDDQEKIVLANSACVQMFGGTIHEVEGRPFWEVVRHRELLELVKKAFRQGAYEDTEISIFTPEEKILHAQVSPVQTEEGKKRGMVCVLHDITSIKRLEALRSEFVANVSHELKTPLTSIKGFVETLAEGALEDPAAARKFLSIIEDHTMRLERLINELLDLARLEGREVLLSIKTLDVKRLVDKARRMYEPQMAAKDQRLEVVFPEIFPQIAGDEEKLERALSNLLHNAIKFTPPRGKITVEGAEEKDCVKILVADTGVGIAEEHLPRIFERFYRVEKSRSREGGGTGLGLSIVKHIVQAHRGDITVQSSVGKGTTFTVSLPKT